MTDAVSAQDPLDPRTESANDRLKALWPVWLARSTAAGVVLHALLFVSWPTWVRSSTSSDSLQEFLQLEWVSVREARSEVNPEPAPAIQIGQLPDSLPNEAELIASASGTGAEVATLSDAFRNRLLGRTALAPTVTEVVTVGNEFAPPGEGDETRAIDVNGELSSAEFSELLGADPLDLDRLSAVQPDLVLVAPSAWVLLRNPREVEQFMVRSYRRGTVDRQEVGSVSVALWIDERGSVEWAEISRSSGHLGMDEVALELFSEVAAFRPARDQGVAVPRSVIFSVRFPWY